jgi:hypothetical protein
LVSGTEGVEGIGTYAVTAGLPTPSLCFGELTHRPSVKQTGIGGLVSPRQAEWGNAPSGNTDRRKPSPATSAQRALVAAIRPDH